MNPIRLPLFLAAVLGATTLHAQFPSPSPSPASIRVVNCDAPVPSEKRGVCANKLDAADFEALAPGVSWYYSWHYEATSIPPANAPMEFIPMCWGADQDKLDGLRKYLSSGHHPRAVLALNEPNLKGQAFIPPEKTAEFYEKIKNLADQYHIPTVGPHMAIGSPDNSSIKAMDPIQHKTVTYTFMTPFLKAFYHYTDEHNVKCGDLGVHSYGNIGELKWVVEMAYKEFGHPVWVTEFAWWGAPNVEEAQKYLMTATDFLENNPHVAGYAWFKERSDNPKISLLDGSGHLSPLGKAYVAMPSHSTNIYYRIPGRLQASRFASSSDMTLDGSKDPGCFLQLEGDDDNATANYNLSVTNPGSYHVKVRVLGHAGRVLQFFEGTTSLGTTTLAKDGWQESEAVLNLPAGNQTLQLKTPVVALNWLEFTAGR